MNAAGAWSQQSRWHWASKQLAQCLHDVLGMVCNHKRDGSGDNVGNRVHQSAGRNMPQGNAGQHAHTLSVQPKVKHMSPVSSSRAS